jgi:hypothetical protein
MKPTCKTVGDNKTFVTLIRIAQEDEEIGRTLGRILSQDCFNRKSMLNTLIQDMRLKSAPVDFIRAIASLLDDDVARKASELLGK